MDLDGWCVPPGAAGLLHAVRVDASRLVRPPAGGVLVLSDVVNPLLGPTGAAGVFGPQKGASPEAVAVIEHALRSWARLIGADPDRPGGGAAGGTAAGLEAVWNAELTSGSAWIANRVGLEAAVGWAEVVVTGEGRFDATSLDGKAVGLVLAEARRQGKDVVVVAGSVDRRVRVAVPTVEVSRLAGSPEAAISRPAKWIRAAGAAAGRLND
jgi:glycerate kinase